MWMKINLMLCAACTVVACAMPAGSRGEEPKMSQDSTDDATPPLPPVAVKRRAPPKVAAVTLDGVRYEQAVLPRSEAAGQRTGYLAAYRGTSDERLWRVRVYELKVDPRLEGDVQDVYFARMEASSDGREILFTNDNGGRLAVDVRTHDVRRLD